MSQIPNQQFARLGLNAVPTIQVATLADADSSIVIPEYTLQTYSINFMTSGEMTGTLNGSPECAQE